MSSFTTQTKNYTSRICPQCNNAILSSKKITDEIYEWICPRCEYHVNLTQEEIQHIKMFEPISYKDYNSYDWTATANDCGPIASTGVIDGSN